MVSKSKAKFNIVSFIQAKVTGPSHRFSEFWSKKEPYLLYKLQFLDEKNKQTTKSRNSNTC